MSTRVHHARLLLSRTIARETIEYVFEQVASQVSGVSQVSEAGQETPGTPDGLRFRPGQFISVQVGRDDNDNPILRSYSLASSPERAARDGQLVLVLRLVAGGPGSAFFQTLSPGDPIRFTGPMGFFVNELSHPGDVVYVATGTGIAPIVPMAAEVLRRQEPGRVLLFWGLRDEGDCFWREALDDLAREHPRLTQRLYLSRPGPGYDGPRGRIIQPVLAELPALSAPTFYLCGNGHMIDELKAALVAAGVNRKRQIRTESFFD